MICFLQAVRRSNSLSLISLCLCLILFFRCSSTLFFSDEVAMVALVVGKFLLSSAVNLCLVPLFSSLASPSPPPLLLFLLSSSCLRWFLRAVKGSDGMCGSQNQADRGDPQSASFSHLSCQYAFAYLLLNCANICKDIGTLIHTSTY